MNTARISSLTTYTSSPKEDAGNGLTSQTANMTWNGLAGGTTYYFRFCAENSKGFSKGLIISFTTSSPGSPPIVATLSTTSVGANTATLNGNVTANGLATNAWFEYGTDPNLASSASTSSQSVGSGTTSQSVSAALTGLTSGTTYYYRVAASNSSGTTRGSIASFIPGGAPTVTTLAATSVGANTATLNGNVTANGLATNAWFEYGTDPNFASSASTSSQSAGSGTTSQSVSAALTGLTSGTTYYYRVAASNSSGTSRGSIASFIPRGTPPPVGPYPVSVHSSGRYLVDNTGLPFLLIGDSPQGMIANLSLADAEVYFASRQSYGYNAVQIHLLAGPTFNGRSDFSTVDGITPFTTAGDISTPREAYFARVDSIVNLAAQHNMLVFLTAAETIDAESLFSSNGVTKCRAFGQYLGNRYKDYKNVAWNYGNDFQDWSTNSAARNAVIAVADGIKDNAPNQLNTAWLDYLLSASRDSSDFDSRIQLDFAYTYFPTYSLTLVEYAKSPAKPIHLGESNYEEESLRGYLTTPVILRRQNYWAMTSGASGVFSVNGYMWNFRSGWKSHLDSTGTKELVNLINLFQSISWWKLVPDSTHQILTAGYGTYASGETGSIATNDYASAAMTSDNTTMVAYLPTSRTVTVNMGKFAGSNVTASWYNPTIGVSTIIGTYAASGSRSFTPSSGDWVLVLLAAP